MFNIPLLTISPTALIVSIAAHMLIGMLWYSPLLFGNLWLTLNKFKPGSVVMHSGHIVGSILTAATIAITLSNLFKMLAITTCLASIQYSLLLWLGFVTTVQFGAVLWTRQPIGLFMIITGYWATIITITGCIVTKL